MADRVCLRQVRKAMLLYVENIIFMVDRKDSLKNKAEQFFYLF